MKNVKKIFLSVLAIVLVLQMALLTPVSAFAEEVTDGGDGTVTETPELTEAPWLLADFEDVPEEWNTNDESFTYQRARGTTHYQSTFELDTASVAQGTNSLKANVGVQGNFEAILQLKKEGEAAPTYEALTFYAKLPAGTYVNSKGVVTGISLRLADADEVAATVILDNADFTYYFPDGTRLAKKDDNAIYPYDNGGNINSNGFEGYVAVSLKGCDLETYENVFISANTTTWGEPFRGKSIYFDDFRGSDLSSFEPYAYVGKYTSTTNLPAIYGTGVSVEDFENIGLSSENTANSGTYSNITLTNTCGSNFQISSTGTSRSSTSLQVNVSNQAYFKYFLNLKNYGDAIKENGDLVFYVKLPSGSVNYTGTNETHLANQPDGKYGIGLGYATTNGNDAGADKKLQNREITYYFKDGSKVTKTESGIYPYKKDGNVSTTGFEGYVSISLADMDLTTTPYLIINALSTTWGGFLQSQKVYFDDFRICDAEGFAPYGWIDYESVADSWKPTDWYATGTYTYARNFFNAVPAFNTNAAAQGKKSLEISLPRGGFTMYTQLAAKDATAPLFGAGYNGLAFYMDIPATTTDNFLPIQVGLASAGDGGAVSQLNTVFAYWFDDGSVVVKHGDGGILPYDKNGNLTEDGFEGYVAVYTGDQNILSNRFLRISSPEYNAALTNKTVYFDDFRPCNFMEWTEEIAEGDQLVVFNNKIALTEGADVTYVPVTTSLTLAENAQGLTSIRNAFLDGLANHDKYDTNKDGEIDARDIVNLKKRAAS